MLATIWALASSITIGEGIAIALLIYLVYRNGRK